MDNTSAIDNSAAQSKPIIERNLVNLDRFLKTHNSGLVKLITNDRDIAATTKPLILAFHNFKKFGAQLKQWLDVLYKLAAEYVGQVDFAVTDFTTLSYGAQWNKFNYHILGLKSRPRIFAFDLNGQKYRMDVCFNSANLKEFTDSLLTGSLYKSESLPDEISEYRIKTAVANNFNKLVLNNDIDIFLIFYAPWCLISQELLSNLNELSSLLQEPDELLIVKMNAIENYVPPEFNIVSYPRCFYIRRNDKTNHVQYDQGPHSVQNLIKFIAANATKELQCWDRNGCLKKIYQKKTERVPTQQVLHLYNISDIKRVLRKNYDGLIEVLTNTKEIFEHKKPLILIYHNFKKFLTHLEPLCDIVEEVAKMYREKVDFAIADIGLIDIGASSNKFGYNIFNSSVQPWIFAFDEHKSQYQMNDLLNVENLNKFTVDLVRNELTAKHPLLLLKDVEPLVEIAVDANFHELVLDNKRDVFVAFLKSTCPFSNELSLTLEDLANLLQDDAEQIIVKMDIEKNHIPPEFSILSYPKCFYLKLGDKNNHILYESWPRTIESLVKFIAAHSTQELKHYYRNGTMKKDDDVISQELSKASFANGIS